MAEKQSDTRPASISRRKFIQRVGAVLGGIALGAAIYKSEGFQSYTKDIRAEGERRKQLMTRSLGPEPGEDASWWRELSEQEIQELAQIPELQPIREKYISTVSPVFQQKAEEAGYRFIYQGDPEDTVGRSVVADKRQMNRGNDDLGFGLNDIYAKGIFEAWVPDPKDPQQQKGIYALLRDPIRNISFLVRIDLTLRDPNRFTSSGRIDLPSYLWVDDLSYGPDDIKQKGEIAGFESLSSYQIPSLEDPPEVKWKAPINSEERMFYHLIRIQGYSPLDIAKPGNFVIAILDADYNNLGIPFVIKDQNGIGKGDLIIRRIGGFTQWKAEIE